MDTQPVDVLLHYQHDLDFLQHYMLGTHYEEIIEAYVWYDEALATMIEKIPQVAIPAMYNPSFMLKISGSKKYSA